MVARPWSSPRVSCAELKSSDVSGTPGIFPEQAGKGSLLPNYEPETGLLGCGRDSRASSRVETGMSGNFLSCRKAVKDPLEFPEVRCD